MKLPFKAFTIDQIQESVKDLIILPVGAVKKEQLKQIAAKLDRHPEDLCLSVIDSLLDSWIKAPDLSDILPLDSDHRFDQLSDDLKLKLAFLSDPYGIPVNSLLEFFVTGLFSDPALVSRYKLWLAVQHATDSTLSADDFYVTDSFGSDFGG